MVKKRLITLSKDEEYDAKYYYLLWRIALKTKNKRLEMKRLQTEMEDLGYTRRTIQRIERGKFDMTLTDLLKIESTLGIPVEELIKVPKDVMEKIRRGQPLEQSDYIKN